ncbi:pelota family protein, partial [Candidatus Woesearchaeota archaeon]|nr:pelota family protein [Candidatus Woesearchaeota archaeon]
VLGPIVDGPDDMPRGNAHSFSLSPGTEITIHKNEWANYQRQRLEEATKTRRQVLIVLFDRERALFLAVSGRRVETLMKLKGDVSKKGLDEQTKSTFYQDIVKHTQEYWTRLKPAGIVYASPAFWHEYVKKQLPAELKKHIVFTTISDVDRTAVHELVKRPELQSVLKDNRATMELGYVDEIHAALAHDKLAYGDKDVVEAIANGNIKGVYVTETRIRKARDEEKFVELEKAMKAAEKAGGAVHIISSDEACRKLDGLGGFVALQRW